MSNSKIYRSQPMVLCQVIIPSEVAYEALGELGELGLAMFKDLNSDVNTFSRTFVKEIRQLDEMDRKLRYFSKQVEDVNIVKSVDKDLISLDAHEKYSLIAEADIPDLDDRMTQVENELREMNDNEETLNKNYRELLELRSVISTTSQFFDNSYNNFDEYSDSSILPMHTDTIQQVNMTGGVKIGHVTGLLDAERFEGFERVMWRGCRGNVYLRNAGVQEQISDIKSGEDKPNKLAFIAVYQGDVLEKKVKRICAGFGATTYPIPEPQRERLTMTDKVNQSIAELEMVRLHTIEYRRKLLREIAPDLEKWNVLVKKALMTYHTLNKFTTGMASALVGEGWIPTAKLGEIHSALHRAVERKGGGVPAIVKRIATTEPAPTWILTNKFTKAYQVIMDAYGVPTYGEQNPGLWCLITFPFLFAVMFGDVGHGIILTLIGMAMIYWESKIISQKSNNEMWTTLFQGRYIILLMGLFSTYTGFIYNDIFSKQMFIFPRGWDLPTESFNGTYKLNITGLCFANESPELCPMCPDGCGWNGNPYPIGVDPTWTLAENKLNFLNSFKMKVSVLIGVVHMSIGICMQCVNHLYFNQGYRVWAEFFPQIIFLLAIFGYMDLMILMKWCMSFGTICIPNMDQNCPDINPNPPPESGILRVQTDPNLLVTMVNMFLAPGSVSYEDNTYLYAGQGTAQTILVLLAVACIPWMLIAKPAVIKKQITKAKIQNRGGLEQSNDDGEGHTIFVDQHVEEHHDFSEVVVEQCIHTIEFALGAVSNTASYLRLWALSLAHAQLSEVLWDMVLESVLTMNGALGGIMTFLGFAVWATLTMAILIGMEGMSSFLHALRLHWVEFNNKYYDGQGYYFSPFAFRKIFSE
eukprot:CFRG5555T1